jgi:penicillin-binding protein 2
MAAPSSLKDPRREIQLFTERTLIVIIVIALLSFVLIGRLFYLQILQNKTYQTLSQQNQLNVVPLEPKRGLIYDRNGILLAENIPVFSLEIIPNKVPELKETLAELATVISISPAEISLFRKQKKHRRRFESIPLRLKLTEEEVARFSVEQYRFPGVIVRAQLIRHYPLGANFVPVLGYISRISEKEMEKLDPVNYSASRYIGKLGVEKFYEEELHGKVGYEQAETDATGRIVRVLKRTPPTPGTNLQLSIDSRLQQIAQAAMGENTGAVVAIQPSTGQILALVSNPVYDPNLFVAGIRSKDFKQLQQDPNKPLYNRAIRGQYPPGSTIKPFLALQGLSLNLITPTSGLFDPGYYQLKNSSHSYRDWLRGGHGWVDLTKAIRESCDIYFYTLASKMGIQHLYNALQKFGLGARTGIDSNEELAGLLPSPEWKKRVQGTAWYPGDTVISGIGQGFMLTTPLQLASATAILSQRGQGMKPSFLLRKQTGNGAWIDEKPTPLPPVKFSDTAWDAVIDAMEEVISAGTGKKYFGKNTPYTVAGKTGTAQVFSLKQQKYDASKLPKHLHDHTWFIAFAPVENPHIAVAVILEHSKGAGDVARKIIDSYLGVEDTTQKPHPETSTAAGLSESSIEEEDDRTENFAHQLPLPEPNTTEDEIPEDDIADE